MDAFFATALLLMALAGVGFAVSSALRMRGEETSGRLEPVLATAVSRRRWLFGSLLVTARRHHGGAGPGRAGSGDLLRRHERCGPAEVGRMAGLSLAYLPASSLLAALAVLLIGWFPGHREWPGARSPCASSSAGSAACSGCRAG